MPKRPRLRLDKEDPPIIATHRLIMIIGSSRYALDISTKCTKLKPSRAEVIPINRQLKKGTLKPIPKNTEIRSSEVIWDHLENAPAALPWCAAYIWFSFLPPDSLGRGIVPPA